MNRCGVVLWMVGCVCALQVSSAEEAPKHRVLLELFESQGCSSCPSAEEFLGKIATVDFREKAVVLSWHVTYWDYLGWQDKFASKAFTERQQKYVALGRVRGLQTPQLMIGNAPFSTGGELTQSLERAAAQKPAFAIAATPTVDGSTLTVSIGLKKLVADAALNANVRLVPFLVRNQATTKPLSGENRGASLVEHFIVLQAAQVLDATSALNGPLTASFTLPEAIDGSNLSIAVLLEDVSTLRTLECISVPLVLK